jgi:predicted metal-binding membrane protein
MADAVFERLLRRDRVVILVALLTLATLAWAYVLWLAAQMRMDMPAARMIPATLGWMVPADSRWSALELTLVFLMWAVMMIGMMLPSAAPMLLIYARVGRQAAMQQRPFAATGWFLAGYLAVWAGFSLAATLAQWGLQRAAILNSMMQVSDQRLAGGLLLAAGLYQWSSLKQECLRQCQGPLVFLQRHGGFRRQPLAALGLGARHGLYCLACCWILMLVLFFVGVMNVLWIAALTAFVLLERSVPAGVWISRLVGIAVCAWGVWLLAGH